MTLVAHITCSSPSTTRIRRRRRSSPPTSRAPTAARLPCSGRCRSRCLRRRSTAQRRWGLTLVAPEDQSELDRLARERLDEYATRLGGDLDVRTAIGRGTLQEAVEHELERRDYDMVVVSATHDGWFGHLSHEHALHKLLRHCMVPVLLVPQAAAEAAHEEAA